MTTFENPLLSEPEEVIFEDDILDLQPGDPDWSMTSSEWWEEFNGNACCPTAGYAAAWLCGCGGSAAIPTGISRFLHDPEGYEL